MRRRNPSRLCGPFYICFPPPPLYGQQFEEFFGLFLKSFPPLFSFFFYPFGACRRMSFSAASIDTSALSYFVVLILRLASFLIYFFSCYSALLLTVNDFSRRSFFALITFPLQDRFPVDVSLVSPVLRLTLVPGRLDFRT